MQIIKRFDVSEILIAAAGVLLIVAIAFAF